MYGRERRVLLRHYLERGLSKSEVARSLGISRGTLYHWIHGGQLDRDLDNAAVRYKPRPAVACKIDPYREMIQVRLAEYPRLSGCCTLCARPWCRVPRGSSMKYALGVSACTCQLAQVWRKSWKRKPDNPEPEAPAGARWLGDHGHGDALRAPRARAAGAVRGEERARARSGAGRGTKSGTLGNRRKTPRVSCWFEWKGRDSNPRPRHYECRALTS